MNQYSCKLLFQWNPCRDGEEYRKRRVCEERIYTYMANTPEEALAKAKKSGNDGCFPRCEAPASTIPYWSIELQ